MGDEATKTVRHINRSFVVTETNGNEKQIKVTVVVEKLRFIFLISFMVIIGVGVVLTELFTPHFVSGDIKKPLRDAFGVLSVCVYFDYPPATYVLPTLYALELFFIYMYVIAIVFRAWIAKEEGKLSCCSFGVFTSAFVYIALSMSYFSTIFAVQPNPEGTREEMIRSISMHTIPYTNLMIALCVLQVVVTWFNIQISWKTLGVSWYIRGSSYCLTVGLIITSLVKILCHINALTDLGNGSMWTVNDETINRYLQIHDYVWLAFALVLPAIQSGYLAYCKYDNHVVIFSVSDNRRANTGQEKGDTEPTATTLLSLSRVTNEI